MKFKIGTRGSDLALWQTRWVSDRLREHHAGIELEEIIIKTHGDAVQDRDFGPEWPVGAFVSALENALLANEVDIAVHSFKDLQTAETAGLTISAIPVRAPVHDVLITREVDGLESLPDGARIGTNSPRRGAQLKHQRECEIVPLRGNVPTRIRKLDEQQLDAIVLAAAGVTRLEIEHPRMFPLDVSTMLPAPAQGALAIQTRSDDPAAEAVAALDHAETRRQVTAERSFLAAINAGCHTPVGALAALDGEQISLHGRMFSDDWSRCAEGTETGTDPIEVGRQLAKRLLAELE
jgi:hydroxymethylbilane synthase